MKKILFYCFARYMSGYLNFMTSQYKSSRQKCQFINENWFDISLEKAK